METDDLQGQELVLQAWDLFSKKLNLQLEAQKSIFHGIKRVTFGTVKIEDLLNFSCLLKHMKTPEQIGNFMKVIFLKNNVNQGSGVLKRTCLII